MRVYDNCYELMSEIFREVWEMGYQIHTTSMQNKIIKDDKEFSTREITNYSYCLTGLKKLDYLFFTDINARVWADAEFQERISEKHHNPGEAWKLRSEVWKEFITRDGKFDYSYNERMRPKLPGVIETLQNDGGSRQAILSIWEDEDINWVGGQRRVPCSIYYHFLYRNGQLDIIYNQRSADVVTHFGNDVYLAFRLMQYVAEQVGVKPGHLYHNIGSLHSYKKDWPKLKTYIEDLQGK